MNETAALIDACRTLASCYLEPTRELAAELEAFDRRLAPLGSDAEAGATALRAELESVGSEELLKDYASLFHGPFGTKAPPFGSVYLDDGGNIMGPSTQAVNRMYREAGLDMADDFQNPPDHIVAELEFLAYLAAEESAARETGDSERARRMGELAAQFRARHIGVWIAPFTARIEAAAATGFYRVLAALTRDVLAFPFPR